MTSVLTTDLALWTDVCALAALVPGRGRAALIGDEQIAIFRLADDSVYAVSNYDPFSCAHVMSRGIVGSRGGLPKVAAPVYKQNFDLRTGVCLDDATVSIAVYPVRVVDGRVEIGTP